MENTEREREDETGTGPGSILGDGPGTRPIRAKKLPSGTGGRENEGERERGEERDGHWPGRYGWNICLVGCN